MHIACHIRCDATFARLVDVLAQAGFQSERFLSEISLMRSARRRSFGLILVDIDNAPFDQDSIYSWLNCRTGESTPVVMLATVHDPDRIAQALNAGIDDYIPDQIDPAELIARLHAILRRYQRTAAKSTIELQGFRLEWEQSRIFDHDIEIEVTPREFTMAWLLFSSPATYLSREIISKAVWNVESDLAGRTIEQHVYKLRKKLNLCTERGAWIRTVYNRGYSLQLRHDEMTAACGGTEEMLTKTYVTDS